MTGLREVIETKGVFCALYSDRGSHFFWTPKAGEPVDKHRLTQVGRALKELGVQMIPAYSPQARGRSERNFGTWQGRLPQELRLARISTLEAANRFLLSTISMYSTASSPSRLNRKQVPSDIPAGRIWTGFSACKRNAWWPKTIPSASVNECGRLRSLVFAARSPVVRSPFMNTSTDGYRCATARMWSGGSIAKADHS